MNNKQNLQNIKYFWWLPLSLFCFYYLIIIFNESSRTIELQDKVNRKVSRASALIKPYREGRVIDVYEKVGERGAFCSLSGEFSLVLVFKNGHYLLAGSSERLMADAPKAHDEYIVEVGSYSQDKEVITLDSKGSKSTRKKVSVLNIGRTSKRVNTLSYYSDILSDTYCSEPEARLAESLKTDYMD